MLQDIFIIHWVKTVIYLLGLSGSQSLDGYRLETWSRLEVNQSLSVAQMTHDNPPTESLSRSSPRVSGTVLEHPLKREEDGQCGRPGKNNVCGLGSESMCSQHILI